MPTPKQQIRMPDELWEQVVARARERGYSGAAAVRAFCERYAAGELDELWWLGELEPLNEDSPAAAATVGGASGGGGEA